ncbi:MAG: ArsR family transcriptional regulator [Ornithinimicrobium sp.]
MNTERTFDVVARAHTHAALSDVNRLRIVDLLALSDVSFSRLGAAMKMPSNLLAHHVRILEDAGVVTRHRSEGDRRRTYITLNRHDPPLDNEPGPPARPPQGRRVLFVCTANTARSHLAAALWRKRSAVDAVSAGTHPGQRVHPAALATAQRHHLDLPDVPPRRLGDTLDPNDLVITVCDRAHEELERNGWAHWSVPDPVPDGTEAAFEEAYAALRQRVHTLAG